MNTSNITLIYNDTITLPTRGAMKKPKVEKQLFRFPSDHFTKDELMSLYAWSTNRENANLFVLIITLLNENYELKYDSFRKTRTYEHANIIRV